MEMWETAVFHTQLLEMKHGHSKLCVLAVGTVVDFGGEPTSVAEPRQVYALRDVILIQGLSHRSFGSIWMPSSGLAEADMVASGHSRLATRAHDLASFDHIFVHSSLAKVAVDRL
jgi:hypothetical protein